MIFSTKYYKKLYAISALSLSILIFCPSASTALPLPHQVKQYMVFAKVFANALRNFTMGTVSQHITIEDKLAKIYKENEATMQDPQKMATALKDAINGNQTINKDNFKLGASSSAFQTEGGLDNTSASARFFKKQNLETAGEAIDFHNKYATDISDMKNNLFINAHRISIAWNRVQPTKDGFNQEGINYYKNLLQEELKNGIQPMVVFHHYDIPTWFEDEGAFEKQENGKYFEDFVLKMYESMPKELGKSMISMSNAPEGPAFKGYFTGDCTPGQKDNLHMTHTVIANTYYSCVEGALKIQTKYAELKAHNSDIEKPNIGIQINILPIDPLTTTSWKDRLKSALGCAIGNYVQSGGTFNFLINGEYRMYTPNLAFLKTAKGVNVYRHHPNAHKAFDWIGVNTYSNRFVNGFTPVDNNAIGDSEERKTDNPNYRNYPEANYRAIKEISDKLAKPLGKLKNEDGRSLPIIVTENGIATQNEEKRKLFFQRALCFIMQSIKDGCRVEGYLPWASHDNYEWPTQKSPEAFGTKRYGFFHVNFDKNSIDYLKRTLKKSSEYYAAVAKAFFNITT